MRSPTPAVRAALFGLAIVVLVSIAGVALHLAAVDRDATAATEQAVLDRASTVAAALRIGSRTDMSRALEPFDGAGVSGDLVLVGPVGRVVASTDSDLASGLDWRSVTLGESGPPHTVRGRGGDVVVAVRPTWEGGPHVAAVQALSGAATENAAVEALASVLGLGGLLAAALVVMAWYAGPRTVKDLALLGERIAHGGGDRAALVRHGSRALGPLAESFLPIASRLTAQDREVSGTREHVAALYQINPHYVLLCTLDGMIVEANPAFYAMTGLPIDAVRGGRIDALRETFPIEPLMETARRSLREGSSVSGIEYAIINRDDETRPVEVSLRAFTLGEDDLVVIQATDLSRQKTLERRVAAFSDTLDLMVDQRVQQLTVGQQTLQTVLDAAGVAIASFDAGGATRRWNGGAKALTGRAIAGVPHFAAVTSVLGLDPTERAAFTQWFWSPSVDPFVARHAVEVDGDAYVRQLIWQRVHADINGRSDLRTLVGVEVPAHLDILPEADALHIEHALADPETAPPSAPQEPVNATDS